MNSTAMRPFRILLLCLLPYRVAFAEPDLEAQRQSDEYRHCLRLAKAKPDDGYEEALAWGSLGGGEPAKHCAALARIGQKQYADGAKRLESLARESHLDATMRADMLSQAAQAWMLDGNADQADADQRSALALVPDHTDILIDHAVTLAQVHHYKEAADELTKVIARHPERIDALILRASAWRYLDNRKAALDDVERALLQDPANADGLVERGILRRLDGDDKGARADWLRVVKEVPSGPALDAAQRNLELMDVKGEQPAKP